MPSSNQSFLEDFLDSISSKNRSGVWGRRPPEAGASSVKRFGDVKCQMYIVFQKETTRNKNGTHVKSDSEHKIRNFNLLAK